MMTIESPPATGSEQVPETLEVSQLSESLAVLRAGRRSLPREEAMDLFRRRLARIQSHVQRVFEQDQINGMAAAQLLAKLMDGLIVVMVDYARAEVMPNAADRLAVVATGGFGRGELAPFSDIDLLFLTQDKASSAVLKTVEFMLYFLWDLGLKVGHATRSVKECLKEARADTTVRTALLDARRLTGDELLFEQFRVAFRRACLKLSAGDFIAAKRAEREMRHQRYGDSPFMVEPHIKEGRGGLRDLQTLYWMARYLLGIEAMTELSGIDGPSGGVLMSAMETRHFLRATAFLWTLRFHLHYVTGRAEERLTFDLQPIIGARMGYTRHGRQDGVERFMRHYFLTVRDVTQLSRVVEPELLRYARGSQALPAKADRALRAAGFAIVDGKLLFADESSIIGKPILLLQLILTARERNLELHPLALRALIRHERRAIELRGNPEAAALFLNLLCGLYNGAGSRLTDSAKWMRILNETGILSRLLPDWGRIVGQMQFDTYHVFTVDEHTIEAIRILNSLERGELADVAPVASSLMGHVQSRRALYVALLLHDIAKGRGGDHSELGAEIALSVGPNLGLDPEETEMASWLVLYHLLLSQTAFHRDIDDPKTILDLVDTIQSPERLKLLLVLTVADMRAVSAKVWNGWKATLLRELYNRVAEALAGGLATTERDVRIAQAKDASKMLLGDWPPEEVDAFLELGYPSYWLSFDAETHARHARMIRGARASRAPLTVSTEILPTRAVTEVTVYTADHPGLFSRIAGALAVAGASIVDARIHTLTDGMALDTFWIQDAAGGSFDAPHRLARLSVVIEQALSGRLKLAAEIRKLSKALLGQRMRAIHVPPRVVIDNHASNTHTVVEVNGRDRPGLLHDVTAAMTAQGMQIASAHISTYGVRAVDVFYVKDVFGLKVESETKLTSLRNAILKALAEREDDGCIRQVPEPARRRSIRQPQPIA